MTVQIEDITITYPDLAFAFNPITIKLEGFEPGYQIYCKANNIEFAKQADSNGVIYFNLSSIGQMMFNRFEFSNVEVEDTTLFKDINFELYYTPGFPFLTGIIPVIWGALQIGETYTQNKTLTWFRGFPFTMPLFAENRITLKANGTEYRVLDAGKYNLTIYDLQSLDNIDITLFDDEFYSLFDYTFDRTFGAQRVLVPKNLSIKIKVLDCPDDGVYLRWINRYGEYNYYLFEPSIETWEVKDSNISFDNIYYTTDFTNNYHNGTSKLIGKDISIAKKIYAHLVDEDTYRMLIGLVSSPVIDMLIGYTDNVPNWMSVNIQDGTFTKSLSNLQDFECSLLPGNMLIQNL